MTDDPYTVLAELVEQVALTGHFENAVEGDIWFRARTLVAAHRAGQRTEHRPDLIDADGYRWDWTSDEGYQGPLGFCLPSREDVDDFCGPVTEAEETD